MLRTRRVEAEEEKPREHSVSFGALAGAPWESSPAPAEPPAAHGSAGTGKEQEWVALDKGLRNAGTPPASAFRIPELGDEVELATVATSITREQFWWVMTKWMESGVVILKSTLRVSGLHIYHGTDSVNSLPGELHPVRVADAGVAARRA